MVVKEHNKKKFKDITADIMKASKTKKKFRQVIKKSGIIPFTNL